MQGIKRGRQKGQQDTRESGLTTLRRGFQWTAWLSAHLEKRFLIDCMALRPLEAFDVTLVTLMVLKGRDVSLSTLNMLVFRLDA